MSSEVVIRVNDLSKRYEIYREPKHRFWQIVLGRFKRFYTEFWALRDVEFEVRKGECIGIIGRNGAGKSTLLQVLVGVLEATSGSVQVQGRVAALLELGSGFNPEFTGRENVELNAILLGLSRQDLLDKFEDIVEFAEIGEFLDQPVKTYSSGMKMRLAFAVHAQLSPEILIVDEALAVGDAAFQRKCLAKMKSLIDEGVSVLLVTHSVQTVRTFCDKALWLHEGRVRQFGTSVDVCSSYMQFLFAGDSNTEFAISEETPSTIAADLVMFDDNALDAVGGNRRWGSGELRIMGFSMTGVQSGMAGFVNLGENVEVEFEAIVTTDMLGTEVSAAFSLRDSRGIDVIAISNDVRGPMISDLSEGERVRAKFSFTNILVPGEYVLILAIEFHEDNERKYADYVEDAYSFKSVSNSPHLGLVEPPYEVSFARA